MKRFVLPLMIILGLLISEHTLAQKQNIPNVIKPVFYGKSKAIRDVPVIIPGPLIKKTETPENPLPEIDIPFDAALHGKIYPQVKQNYHGLMAMKSPFLNVEGIDNVQGYNAADPNGDIGKDHYIQTTNTQFGVFDRQGNMIYGPVDYKSLFGTFPGPWSDLNWCDPVIVYDHLADRWAFTTMSINQTLGLYYEMVAVSASADPLGEYYCYAYQFDNLNDYPKMSVWPNGYYITYNIFEPGGINSWQFSHALVTAVDRDAMLSGTPDATMIQFEIEEPNLLTTRRSPLTADFNGWEMPEDNVCPVVIPEFAMTGFPWPMKVNIFGLEPDWLNPTNSSFDSIIQFEVEGTFPLIVGNAPQPGNFHDVETVQFNMMYPLNYRNLGSFETMAACQTLYDGEKHYLRWYEFRRDTDNWYLYQTGNYAPDSSSRYMPSISVNGNGDIAMGFTKSSLEINPSIWLTGRQSDDPPGEMTFGEIELYKGLNYANNYSTSNGRNRWGDYASMMVDPLDDTTFWFTSMYTLEHTNHGNWSTRIFAFSLNESTDAPYAWAGNDTTICGYETLQLNGAAENYSSLGWETMGDGMFSNDNQLNPIYLRGNQDLENGFVDLCLSLTGYVPGSCCSDTMTLYLNKLPEVEAGADDTICVNYSITLNGDASFADHCFWATSGSGSFNDSSLLNAIYTPSSADTSFEYISLRLHAEPLFPCTEGSSDSLMLIVESCVGVNELNLSQFSMSVYPNPSTGMINLSADFKEESAPIINIFDAGGMRLFTGSFVSAQNTLLKQFDLSQYPGGIYYLQLINNNITKTMKVVLIK